MVKNQRLFYVVPKCLLYGTMNCGIRHVDDPGFRGQIVLVDYEHIDARACQLLHIRKKIVETYSVLEVYHRAYGGNILYNEDSGVWTCSCQIGPTMFRHIFDETVECIKSGDIVHLFPAC